MNDEPARILASLVARYGTSLAYDPLRCEGLLRDTCARCTREIFVLVNAVRQQVPADLLSPRHSLPFPLFKGFLAKRLQDELGFSDNAAQWAVETWSVALGLDPGGPGKDPLRDATTVSPGNRKSTVPEDQRTRWADDLGSDRQGTRLGAVRGLAETGDPACIPLLISALENDQWQVRSAAYDALVHTGDPAVPALVEALGDSHRNLVGSVIFILGAIRAPEAVDPLVRLMESDRDLAGYAIWALGEIGDPRASTPLVKRLSDGNNSLQMAAEEALRKIG
ncbi:HEAT repeat domain-containing protein [Methanoregula sp.]|uniref:HEAT repeat domain-containing protein n=1 Tax=Methanoregula sp. TaxID=2052170 RepID=UPI003C770E3B